MQSSALAISAALSAPQSNQLSVRLIEDIKGLGKKGEAILMALMPSDVTISEELDTFMVGFSPGGFRADEACPIQLVGKDTGYYRVFGLNNAFRPVNVLSSIQADIPEVDPESTFATYLVQERALGGFIPTVTQLNADEGNSSFDPKIALLRRVAWAMALDRELRVFGATGLFRTVANWNANNRATIAAGAEWNDQLNGDPMLDIFDRIEASAQPITDIWVSPPVAHALIRSASVKDHIRTLSGDAALSKEIAAATAAMVNMDFSIPGLPPIHIVGSKVLTESTGALDFILDDTIILTSSPVGAGSSGEDIMTAKTFRRKGPSGTGFTTREFELQRRGLHGGTFCASGHAEQCVMVASTVGGVIYDTLQG
jgi:hypothetical protein